MEGMKTLFVALVGSIITLLAAFGLDVTDEQQDAINGFLLTAWPVAMIVMRLVTKGPVKIPGKGGSQSGFVHPALLVVLLTLGVVFIGGCAGNPIKAAETAEQKAFAAYGLFVVLEERAADVMGDPAVPDSVKTRIQRIDARLKPMADSVRKTVALAQEVREEVAEGQGTEAKLQVITREINSWLTRFLPLLDDFKSAVRG